MLLLNLWLKLIKVIDSSATDALTQQQLSQLDERLRKDIGLHSFHDRAELIQALDKVKAATTFCCSRHETLTSNKANKTTKTACC